jgi:hypothetical protein
VWIGNLIYDAETGQPIELVEAPDGLLKLWVIPKGKLELPVGRYGLGNDVAAGTGATPSTTAGYNADTGHKVLEYAYALIFPNNFAEFVAALGRLLRDKDGRPALVGWEIQGGNTFDMRMRQLGYERCYIKADDLADGKPRDQKGRRGVNTSSESFLPLMGSYRAALYAKECVNHSEWALDETLRFVYTNRGVEYRGRTKPLKQAEAGSLATMHHGDIVTADVIAWKMVEELGVIAKGEVEEVIPVGSLAWRRQFRDNRRRQASWV